MSRRRQSLNKGRKIQENSNNEESCDREATLVWEVKEGPA